MKTIRVTGRGTIKVHPDTTRLTVFLKGSYPEYHEAVRGSARDTESLRDIFEGFGFAPSDLKTLSFAVDAQYEDHRERGVYKRRLVGYEYRHSMKVEFDSDNDRLGKILYALARCPAKPEFRLGYTVKDPETVKDELLSRTVADAARKADVMARAAGAALKGIQNIDYAWGSVSLEVHPMSGAFEADDEEIGEFAEACTSYDVSIEPDDIEVSDTVTIVWEIAQEDGKALLSGEDKA